jgi:hypothetical protein
MSPCASNVMQTKNTFSAKYPDSNLIANIHDNNITAAGNTFNNYYDTLLII